MLCYGGSNKQDTRVRHTVDAPSRLLCKVAVSGGAMNITNRGCKDGCSLAFASSPCFEHWALCGAAKAFPNDSQHLGLWFQASLASMSARFGGRAGRQRRGLGNRVTMNHQVADPWRTIKASRYDWRFLTRVCQEEQKGSQHRKGKAYRLGNSPGK